jgi:hypothetical protein
MKMELCDNNNTEISLEKVYTIFFNALLNEGIEPVIQAAYEIFHQPIVLTDDNYRLLYQYPLQKLNQEIWDTLYEQGTLSQETIRYYQEMFLSDKSDDIYDPFYVDWGPAADCPRIFGEIYTPSKKILGHVAIFMVNAPFQPNDLKITKVFIDALLIKMSHRSNNIITNAEYLKELLSADISSPLKYLACNVLQKYIKGNFCLMVTPIGENAAQWAHVSSALQHLGTTYRNTVSTTYNNCIVTLLGEMRATVQTLKERSFLMRVTSILQQTYAFTGISDSFQQLSDISVYYPQAYYTAMLHAAPCCFYSDVAPRPIFALLRERVPMETFMDPVLNEIYVYDQQHATSYFNTLRQYSLLMHNKEAAANNLCIHRNTLLYRLNKIQDIFHLPLEEPNVALRLLNSFQIWDLHFSKP